jgi:hypothetical protein
MQVQTALARDVSANHGLRLDGRTRTGRRMREITASLISAFGREPNAIERMMITNAAAASALLEALQARALRGDPSVTVQDLTKAGNSARRALAALHLPDAKPSVRQNGLRKLEWR